MTSCEPYFDIHNLSAWSYANEIFETTSCVPNGAKFAFFLALFLGYLFVLGLSIMAFLPHALQDWERKLRFPSHKTRIFGMVVLACVADLVADIMFMSGVQSPARFIVYPVSGICMQFAIGMLIVSLATSWVGISKSWGKDNDDLNRSFRFFMLSNILAYFLGVATYVLCLGLLPLIFSILDRPVDVNRSYIAFTVLYGCLRTWMTVSFMVFDGKLYQKTKPDAIIQLRRDDEIVVFRKKLRRYFKLCVSFLLPQLGLILTLLWINYVESLPGAFYIHFSFCQLTTLVAGGGIFFLMRKQGQGTGSRDGTGSASGGTSHVSTGRLSYPAAFNQSIPGSPTRLSMTILSSGDYHDQAGAEYPISAGQGKRDPEDEEKVEV